MTAPPDDDRIEMTCCDCGREFLALGEWQVRCRTCYLAFKEGGDRATLQADLAALQAENDQLRADLDAIRRDRDRLRVEAMRAKLQAPPAIPRDQWRRLMLLVHPDKHDNSPASVKAAQWLNEVRP
jgi:hypothetical protein